MKIPAFHQNRCLCQKELLADCFFQKLCDSKLLSAGVPNILAYSFADVSILLLRILFCHQSRFLLKMGFFHYSPPAQWSVNLCPPPSPNYGKYNKWGDIMEKTQRLSYFSYEASWSFCFGRPA